MRSKSVLSVVVTAVLAGGVVASPAAAAEEVWSVSSPVVTAVLADDPYTPVLEGPDAEDGDTHDCSITGFEHRRVTGANGPSLATGCGGVVVQVTIGSDVPDASGLAVVRATTTSTYGCVHHRTGRARTTLTRAAEVTGRWGTFEIPVVGATAAPLFQYHLLPLETVRCRGKERPSHLSLTVSDLSVSIEPFSQAGPVETHELPGTWTVERPVVHKPGKRVAAPRVA